MEHENFPVYKQAIQKILNDQVYREVFASFRNFGYDVQGNDYYLRNASGGILQSTLLLSLLSTNLPPEEISEILIASMKKNTDLLCKNFEFVVNKIIEAKKGKSIPELCKFFEVEKKPKG